MPKAIVVGGSNGIGLAVTQKLIQKGYFVYVFDRCEPAENFDEQNLSYIKSDLSDFDEGRFLPLLEDEEINTLIITAGLGRVAPFEELHTAEIDKLFKVNTLATIKLIRLFYDRIKGDDNFYTAVMGSIAGLVSSPLFSVYSASKAALCRFLESVNIELEKAGTKNRILNVSPGSLKGTKFSGGENDLSITLPLAEEIIKHSLERQTLFIPEYEEIYKNVLSRYNADPQKFGCESFDYKVKGGRVNGNGGAVIGYLSGTFDLFHVGHLNLIRRAKEQCDYLIVGVHPDASHKGKETFIPFEERLQIVGSVKYVDKAVISVPEDSDAWELWHFNKLFVGSDYKGSERFLKYEEFFEDKDVEIIYFPYTKSTSSTKIREKVLKSKK